MSKIKNEIRKGWLRALFFKTILVYQKWLSPIMGNQCRFYPSCSDYALLNFAYRSVPVAFFSSLWRILRCNPWNKNFGLDYPFGIEAKSADAFIKNHSRRFKSKSKKF